MRDFINFCRHYWFWFLLIMLIFGAAGSVKGASVESVLWEDTLTELQDGDIPGETVPYLSEVFGLAAEQSMWLSFMYAGVWMLVGATAALAAAGTLYILRNKKWFQKLDDLLYR